MANNIEVDWTLARKIAHTSFAAIDSQEIPLRAGVGRILSGDVYALIDLPSFTSSAMDGFAVCGVGPWEIIGNVRPGELTEVKISTGQAVRITTGAIPPKDTDYIIRWEDASVDGNLLSIKEGLNFQAGKDIRPAGAECKKGELLLKSATVLNPGQIGLLASTGYDKITVKRRPKVFLIALGNELQREGVPSNGMVRDSLTVQIPGWIERVHGEVSEISLVKDDFDLVYQALSSAIEECDVLITTGGTAQSASDLIHPVFNKLSAEILIDRVRVRPGHPMVLARIKNKSGRLIPVIALPGNPLSAIVGIMTLVLPLLYSLVDRSMPPLKTISRAEDFSSSGNDTRLILGTVESDVFIPAKYLGSAMLRGLASATGFGVVRDQSDRYIEWLPLP